MFTVCPKCALTLVVTAADLRVAQGYVRCGRCSSVFNALVGLTDERQGAPADAAAPAPQAGAAEPSATPAAAAAPEAAATTSDDDAALADEDSIPADALEFNPATTDVSAVFVDPPPNPQWTAATGSFKAMVAANQDVGQAVPEPAADEVHIDAQFLASVLLSESPAATADAPLASSAIPAAAEPAKPPAHPGVRAPASAAVPPRNIASARLSVPQPRPPLQAATQPARTPEARAESAPQAMTDEEVAATPAPPDYLPLTWRIAAAVAAVLLLLQIVNHYRDTLAATATFNRPLTTLYAALGVPLTPHWDVRAYDVRQLGAAAEPQNAGLLTVRASVKNAAAKPQPLPLLRVTLEDRFGNRIAARDVPPRLYLPHAVPATALLAAGQRIDAQMDFVDPGANAVGFEIDACLQSGGAVTCANDVAARGP
jgi:predicted Zn finger-like uncharacterized protein